MPDNDELLDKLAVCKLLGGTRPINPATLYRGIKKGLYPAPIRVAPNTCRWLRSECLSAIQERIAERDGIEAVEAEAP